MYHPTLNQTLRCAGLLLPMVLLTACGGHKKVAKAERLPKPRWWK